MNILITGSSGFIGISLVQYLKNNYNIIGLDIDDSSKYLCKYFIKIDITNKDKLEKVFTIYNIDYIIHCAFDKSLKNCEENKKRAYNINYIGSKNLYEFSKKYNSKFIFISSDQVFDGKNGFYLENSKTNPINYYGKLKLDIEELIKSDKCSSICRTALVFGEIPSSQKTLFNNLKDSNTLVVQGYIVQHIIYKLSNKSIIKLPIDDFITPTSANMLSLQIKTIIENNLYGTFHCCGSESISRYEFGIKIANHFLLDKSYIQPIEHIDKLRPKNVSLDFTYSENILGIKYENLESALNDFKI